MRVRYKNALWSLFLLVQHMVDAVPTEPAPTTATEKDVLAESETNDREKLEIIKQIKRINNDGTYTVGYEADDGSFKIESRDVLGNVKGTYGYVDQDGEIKRVSYSTSNSTELSSAPTLVPQIEKTSVERQHVPRNRTLTTRRPSLVYPHVTTTTQVPGSSTSVIQTIPRRRTTTSTTTERSKVETATPRSTTPRTVPTRAIFQNGHYIRATASPQEQIVRPQAELPSLRGLLLGRNALLEEVTSRPEGDERGNILRRQLQDNKDQFDTRQHVSNHQQSIGNDAIDVYSASVTTGTPRPLFTTTQRPVIVPVAAGRVVPPRYYQKQLSRGPRPTSEAIQETTTQASETDENYIPNPVQVVPAPRQEALPLVALRHPFHKGTILVPVSQLQNGAYYQDQEYNPAYPQYVIANPVPRESSPPLPPPPPNPVHFVRRPLRPLPVQIDDNGFVQAVRPRPVLSDPDDDIQRQVDRITPPVSTRDFQKLLQLLILRQSRLEQAKQELLQQQRQYQQNGPVQFVQNPEDYRPRTFVAVPESRSRDHHYNPSDPYNIGGNVAMAPYSQGKRVARLLPQEAEEDYLPFDVREMLLLRMLQLAVNPDLPVDDQQIRQHRKEPIRNVEILGEEETEPKDQNRSKRYRDTDY